MRLSMILSLPREPAAVTRARYVLQVLLSLSDATDGCRTHLSVLITEACANAVLHADGDSPIEIAITVDDHECVVEVGNSHGAGNAPVLTSHLPHPLAESGRGLPVIMGLADRARFVTPRPGWVVLRMTKCLASEVQTG